jgi:hypothetical protein
MIMRRRPRSGPDGNLQRRAGQVLRLVGFFGEMGARPGFVMRLVLVILASLALLRSPEPAAAQGVCSDDYVSIETLVGTIIEIDPAPDPFQSADIFIAGPAPCTRMWMQVLKIDAAQCRIGDRIAARGIITSDPDNHVWQINPELNEYMLLGVDFTCTR